MKREFFLVPLASLAIKYFLSTHGLGNCRMRLSSHVDPELTVTAGWCREADIEARSMRHCLHHFYFGSEPWQSLGFDFRKIREGRTETNVHDCSALSCYKISSHCAVNHLATLLVLETIKLLHHVASRQGIGGRRAGQRQRPGGPVDLVEVAGDPGFARVKKILAPKLVGNENR